MTRSATIVPGASGLAAGVAQDSAEGAVSAEGIDQRVRSGDVDGAIAVLRDLDDRTPNQSRYLAWLQQQRGDFGASIRTIDSLLSSRPDDADARLILAYAHWLDGDLAAAAHELELVASVGSANQLAAERARADLTSLTSELRSLEPVAAAERRLEFAFWIAVVTLAVFLTAGLWRGVRVRPLLP